MAVSIGETMMIMGAYSMMDNWCGSSSRQISFSHIDIDVRGDNVSDNGLLDDHRGGDSQSSAERSHDGSGTHLDC
jgi:hypothetical protein